MPPRIQFTRPDFSNYVVHFTKNANPLGHARHQRDSDDVLAAIAPQTAKERLFSILSDGKIYGTSMPWTNRHAVCFTECTWASLLDHSSRYSKFGLGFSKDFLFSRGGAPAIYLTPGQLAHQERHVGEGKDPFADELFTFVTPFCPPYAPKKYKDRFWKERKPVDYSHEREWRVPHDLDFPLQKVAFVIVARYEDMAQAPQELKDAIGRENWLIMENYEKIEEFWPVHRLPTS